jgi:hypothetical protein
MRSLSRLVPDRERAGVRARAERLQLRAGFRDWPGPDRPELSRRVCFAVAAIAPDLGFDRLALLARYAGWSILLDDRLDRPDPDPAALAALRDAVAAVTAGHRPPGPGRADPVPELLAGILRELAGLAGSRAAVRRVGAELRDAVTSGVAHALLGRAVAAGERPAPTVGQYLPVAVRTVNYRSFGYALLALAGCPAGRPAGPATVAGVDRALWLGAGAVRLANDLRSVDRDRAEATLNLLCLPTGSGGQVTAGQVWAAIARRRRAHDAVLDQLDRLPGPAGPTAAPGCLLRRSLRLSVGIYRLGDLR